MNKKFYIFAFLFVLCMPYAAQGMSLDDNDNSQPQEEQTNQLMLQQAEAEAAINHLIRCMALQERLHKDNNDSEEKLTLLAKAIDLLQKCEGGQRGALAERLVTVGIDAIKYHFNFANEETEETILATIYRYRHVF